MGFYLRKSFRLGPMRLNLSKSGLGLDDITDMEFDFDNGLLVLHKRGLGRPSWIKTRPQFKTIFTLFASQIKMRLFGHKKAQKECLPYNPDLKQEIFNFYE